MMIVDRGILLELEGKAATNVKVKSLVSDISRIIVGGVINEENDIDASMLNHILTIGRGSNKCKPAMEKDFGLLKQLLLWQHAFYLLGGEVNSDIKNRYLAMYSHYAESYASLVRTFSNDSDSITIPFNMHLSQPQAESLVALQRFVDAAKVSISVYYKVVEDAFRQCDVKGIMPLWVFHRDVIGNESDWAERLDHWAKCYYVYEQYHAKGMTKTSLVKHLQELEAFSSLYLHQKDKANAIHKVTELLNEAERLILSAKRGTFPL